jgi:hypothetical protein
MFVREQSPGRVTEQEALQKGSFACRGGGRHPDRLKGGVLRGAPLERRSRSVRRMTWVSPHGNDAPMTADVRRAPRRGTSSACATKRMHSTQAREIVACSWRTRPSLGPSTCARRSSLCNTGASSGWWGVRVGITVGQTRATGRNQHWGRLERTERSSPRVTASARERA